MKIWSVDKMIRTLAVLIPVTVLYMLGIRTEYVRTIRNTVAYRLPFRVPGLAPCPDCNILVVNLDSLRAKELPCYGYDRDTAPNLCKFADDNIRFSRFYSQSSFTLDSHMSVFTGLYPSTHHVTDALKDSLSEEIETLPQILKRNGYRNIWAGMTDDVNLPLDRGLGRGYDEIFNLDGNSESWTDEYGKLLPKLLDDTPTFMFLHTYGVHAPYLVGRKNRRFVQDAYPRVPVTREEYDAQSREYYEYVISEFEDRLKSSKTSESRERNTDIIRNLRSALDDGDLERAKNITWTFPNYEVFDLLFAWYYLQVDANDPAMVSFIQGLYDERIYQVDRLLVPLLRFLNREDVRKKTIVIFFSDNGEEFMEHGYFDHAWNIYDNATHVPFIMAAPRMNKGVYRDLAQTVDMVPTLLDLVGIPLTKKIDGTSLRPILDGRGPLHVGDRYVVGQHRGDDIVSIRNSRWKMYKNNTPEKRFVELYDLLTDPGEQVNVLGDHLPAARLLDEALTLILEASPKYASVSGEFPGWIDEEKRKKLIESGYF